MPSAATWMDLEIVILSEVRQKKTNFIKVAKVTTGLDWAHAPARRAYERAGFKRHLDSTTYYLDLEEKKNDIPKA